MYARIDERVQTIIVNAHRGLEVWHFCGDLLAQIEREGGDESARMRDLVREKLKAGQQRSERASRAIMVALAMYLPEPAYVQEVDRIPGRVRALAAHLVATAKEAASCDEAAKGRFLATWRVMMERANALSVEPANHALLWNLASCLEEVVTHDQAKRGWVVSAFQFFPFEVRYHHGYAGSLCEPVSPPPLGMSESLNELSLLVCSVLHGRSDPQLCRWAIHGALDSLLDFTGGSAAACLQRHLAATTGALCKRSAEEDLASWYRGYDGREKLEALLERASTASTHPQWPNGPEHAELAAAITRAIKRLDLASRRAFPEF